MMSFNVFMLVMVVVALLVFYIMNKVFTKFKKCPLSPKRPYKHKYILDEIIFTLTGSIKIYYMCRFCKEEVYDYNLKKESLIMLHKKFNIPKEDVLEIYEWLEDLKRVSGKAFVKKIIEVSKNREGK